MYYYLLIYIIFINSILDMWHICGVKLHVSILMQNNIAIELYQSFMIQRQNWVKNSKKTWLVDLGVHWRPCMTLLTHIFFKETKISKKKKLYK